MVKEQKDFYNTIENIVEKIEAIPIVLATRLGPWITPLVPAFFVHRAMVKHLNVPTFWGWIAAIALEVVGVAAMFNLLRMYQYNQEKRKSDPAAPIVWAVVTTAAYYLTAFALVLFIEFFPDVVKFAPAAFIVLSGSSAGVLALISDQKRRELAVQLTKKKHPRKCPTPSANNDTLSAQPSKLGGDLGAANAVRLSGVEVKLDAVLDFVESNPNASYRQIGQHIGQSKSSGENYIKRLIEAGRLHKNGNGWEILA